MNVACSARVIQTSDDLLEKHINCVQFTQFQRFSVLYSLQNSFLGQFSADESNVYNGFITLNTNQEEDNPSEITWFI